MDFRPDVTQWTVCSNCKHPLKKNIRADHVLTPSPVLFDSTRFPSPSEVAGSRIALDQTNFELDQLNEEIDELESALAQLRRNREMLETKSQALTAVISPISRLPTEILIEIFEMCCENWKDWWSSEAQLVLSHTWRHWREIALTTPSLWTRITVRFPVKRESQTAMVRRWLEYSRDLPLSVEIVSDPYTPWLSAFNANDPTLELLLLQIDRCEEVILRLSWDDIRRHFNGVKGRLTTLKTLVLTSHGNSRSPNDYFEDAPKLEVAVLNCGCFDSINDRDHPKLHWNALTHLRTKGSAAYAIEVLQHCPSLVSCELGISSVSQSQRFPSILELPRLRTFIVTTGFESCLAFFESLSLPALHSLELAIASNTDDIISLLSRSSHTLARLSLCGYALPGIIACFEAVPRLKHVSFDSGVTLGFMDTLLDRLTINLSSPTTALLPQLESFEIVLAGRRFHEKLCFLNESFAAMILSRWSSQANSESAVPSHVPECRLRSVMIVIEPGMNDHFDDPFEQQGLGGFLRICQGLNRDVSVIKTKPRKWQIHVT